MKFDLEKYIPEGWFEWPEQRRKEYVRERDQEKCQISGTPSRETHEIRPKGLGGRSSRLMPYNMIVLSGVVHRMVHEREFVITKFDPFNLQDGLHVRGKDKNKLYFYEMPRSDEFFEKYDIPKENGREVWI